jgi:hypothetical protein
MLLVAQQHTTQVVAVAVLIPQAFRVQADKAAAVTDQAVSLLQEMQV